MTAPQRSNASEVFRAFLKLGLTSFGGPVAHLGYFRDELVVRRKWLDDRAYGDLIALCQFLPGPTSSQVGFALGLMRGGWLGALAAFCAFTLPSALIMICAALVPMQMDGIAAQGVLHGLKIAAVAIVAQAVWAMARVLCPDRGRVSIAVLAVAVLAFVPSSLGMIAAILIGGIGGLILAQGQGEAGATLPVPIGNRAGIAAGVAFLGLLALLPLLAGHAQWLAVLDSFYRAGALVFGGGHVVLPLLEAEVVQSGWISRDTFIAGYGAAQAIPGPLFTFGAYLGATLVPAPNGIAGAVLALAAIFLPGFLILIAVLPFWSRFGTIGPVRSLMQGANAAVVGILGAALYSPVFTTAIADLRDLALALGCFVALVVWRMPPWAVVAIAVLGGICLVTAQGN